MSLGEFLTSKEIIVVYAIAAAACLLCFIIYLVERNNDKARKRHNTRELNKLVEEVQEQIEVKSIDEYLKDSAPQIVETIEIEDNNQKEEQEEVQIEEIEDTKEEIATKIVESDSDIEELEYIEVQPSIEQAKEELHKVTLELQNNEENQNIGFTNFEEEQEENAIISLEEFIKKGKEIYDKNELQESLDEGDEPISLHELEERVGRTASIITDTFVIENAVPEEELMIEEPVIIESKDINSVNTIISEPIKMEDKGFVPSPIISPIYGIEKELSPQELELENTADYEKLDAEIKKTNEFLMTLRELQKKLD